MMRGLAILALFACLQADAATWYFDNAASGANDGTSWANAWETAADIIWTSGGVQAGDTIKISGGTTSKTYTEALSLAINGTHGNYVTWSNGQDEGHNGMVVLDGFALTLNGSRPKWNRINGAKDPNFVAPTTVAQVDDPSLWTNNIGIWIKGISGTLDSDTSPLVWFFRNPDSIDLRWIGVSGLTNTGSCEFCSIKGGVLKIDMTDEGTDPATNNVFKHLYFERNMGEQVKIVSAVTNGFDSFTFDLCKFYLPGEDVFEVSSGTTIKNCAVGPAFPNGVHCDFYQFEGDFIKVYNTRNYESLNALIRVQSNLNGIRHSIWVFNNWFTEKVGRALGGGTLTELVTFVHTDSGADKAINLVTFSNIVVGNNLWYKSLSNVVVGVPGNPQLARGPVTIFSKGHYVTNAEWKASVFANNLVIDKQEGWTFPQSTNVAGNYESGGLVFRGYLPHTTNDLLVDYNTVANVDIYLTTPRRMSYMDEDANVEVHSFKFSNRTNYPAWVNKDNEDFELLSTDLAALNNGKDMSAYYNFDMLNRPIVGVRDRGPLERQELLFYYSFENDLAGGNATDDSGNGYTGVRMALTEYGYPSNRLASAVGGSVIRTGVSGRASDHLWRTNNGVYNPEYLDDGGIFAVTNIYPVMTNRSELSVMLSARYNSAARSDHHDPDYSLDGNATLLGTGTACGTVGAWDFQRFNQSISQNNTRLLIVTNATLSTPQVGSEDDVVFGKAGRLVINFPDRGFDNDGDTTNWHHYGFSFSNGIVKAYFDGRCFATASVAVVTTTITLARTINRPNPVMVIGGNPHDGTVEFDGDEQPNHGWMNGGLDDIRGVGRAIGWQEFVDYANDEGYSFADAPTEGGGEGGALAAPAAGRATPMRRIF